MHPQRDIILLRIKSHQLPIHHHIGPASSVHHRDGGTLWATAQASVQRTCRPCGVVARIHAHDTERPAKPGVLAGRDEPFGAGRFWHTHDALHGPGRICHAPSALFALASGSPGLSVEIQTQFTSKRRLSSCVSLYYVVLTSCSRLCILLKQNSNRQC